MHPYQPLPFHTLSYANIPAQNLSWLKTITDEIAGEEESIWEEWWI